MLLDVRHAETVFGSDSGGEIGRKVIQITLRYSPAALER
jgi:hypothetical protein